MFMLNKLSFRKLFICLVGITFLFCLFACTSNDLATSMQGANNDSAMKGTLKAFNPEELEDIKSGDAMGGSEEQQLQQERIAGGAVGGISSENITPLEGITDIPDGITTIVYGFHAEPPALDHDYGMQCLSCHKIEEAGSRVNLDVKVLPPQLLPGHVSSNLGEADCLVCHN